MRHRAAFGDKKLGERLPVPIDLETLAFDPADARAALAQLPTTSAVFALFGAEAYAEPYIGRTPNLRGRL